MAGRLDAFLAMLERGEDSALLRFSIGSELLAADRAAEAADHLQQAVELDPDHSAARKLLGKALVGHRLAPARQVLARAAEDLREAEWQRGVLRQLSREAT